MHYKSVQKQTFISSDRSLDRGTSNKYRYMYKYLYKTTKEWERISTKNDPRFSHK